MKTFKEYKIPAERVLKRLRKKGVPLEDIDRMITERALDNGVDVTYSLYYDDDRDEYSCTCPFGSFYGQSKKNQGKYCYHVTTLFKVEK